MHPSAPCISPQSDSGCFTKHPPSCRHAALGFLGFPVLIESCGSRLSEVTVCSMDTRNLPSSPWPCAFESLLPPYAPHAAIQIWCKRTMAVEHKMNGWTFCNNLEYACRLRSMAQYGPVWPSMAHGCVCFHCWATTTAARVATSFAAQPTCCSNQHGLFCQDCRMVASCSISGISILLEASGLCSSFVWPTTTIPLFESFRKQLGSKAPLEIEW